jgi:hypothetical protein
MSSLILVPRWDEVVGVAGATHVGAEEQHRVREAGDEGWGREREGVRRGWMVVDGDKRI